MNVISTEQNKAEMAFYSINILTLLVIFTDFSSGDGTYLYNKLTRTDDTHRLKCTPMEEQRKGCLNNGKCFALELGTRTLHCHCPAIYIGERCEQLDPCAVIPELCTHTEKLHLTTTTVASPTTTSSTSKTRLSTITKTTRPTILTTPVESSTSNATSTLFSHRRVCTETEKKQAACLNGGVCFTLSIGGTIPHCMCKGVYGGNRCQHIDLCIAIPGFCAASGPTISTSTMFITKSTKETAYYSASTRQSVLQALQSTKLYFFKQRPCTKAETNRARCLNGGQCLSVAGRGVMCRCPPMYSGNKCQLPARQKADGETSMFG